MINCNELYEVFKKHDLLFFTGVPDSTFKDWMKFLADEHGEKVTNIIACNECEATAIAAGYHLATKKIPIIYMQNSGLGKTVNPITSLSDPEVYSIPTILMIGWRGEPGIKDEPQHKKMGRITTKMLDTLEIPYIILPDNIDQADQTIAEIKSIAIQENKPVAIIIKKDIFEDYKSKTKAQTNYEMNREDAIKIIVDNLQGNEAIVSTTGKASRELFEYRETLKQGHGFDFLTVGSMGCSSSIAHAIALTDPNRQTIIFDGDGAAIMQMGALATIGNYKAKSLYHIIFDNHSYGSTGGQPTVSPTVDFAKVALACGYNGAKTVETRFDLESSIKEMKSVEGPYMLVINVNQGARKDLGRPTTTPIQNKEMFMEFLQS